MQLSVICFVKPCALEMSEFAPESSQEKWLGGGYIHIHICLQFSQVWKTSANVSRLDDPSDLTGYIALRVIHSEELRGRKPCLLDKNIAEDPG